MKTDAEVLESLDSVIHDLAPEERMVLLTLAQRLLFGQKNYGLLANADPKRDWRKERAEELMDFLVYGAIAEVKATLAGK